MFHFFRFYYAEMRRKLWPKAPAKESVSGQMSKNVQVYTYKFVQETKYIWLSILYYRLAQKKWKLKNGPRLPTLPYSSFGSTTIIIKPSNKTISEKSEAFSHSYRTTDYIILCYRNHVLFKLNFLQRFMNKKNLLIILRMAGKRERLRLKEEVEKTKDRKKKQLEPAELTFIFFFFSQE